MRAIVTRPAPVRGGSAFCQRLDEVVPIHIELEPENQAYLLSLAQVQLARKDPTGARRTLEPLRLPYVEPEIRAHAEQMLKDIGR